MGWGADTELCDNNEVKVCSAQAPRWPRGRRLRPPPEQGQVAQVTSLLRFLLTCTGTAGRFVGKGVVGVHRDTAESRSCGLKGAGEERGWRCHILATAQGGDTRLQQQWTPLSAGSLSRGLCARGELPRSAQTPSPAELRMPQVPSEGNKGMKIQLHVDVCPQIMEIHITPIPVRPLEHCSIPSCPESVLHSPSLSSPQPV